MATATHGDLQFKRSWCFAAVYLTHFVQINKKTLYTNFMRGPGVTEVKTNLKILIKHQDSTVVFVCKCDNGGSMMQ